MREESQLDEMRAAIRGDFERLAQRRGEQELMKLAEPEPEPEPERIEEAAAVPGPEPAAHASPPLELEREPEPDLEREPDPLRDEHPSVDEAEPDRPHRSFLDRLLGR